MKFLNDDLVYDIEIRGNFFVLSQYYPARNGVIISYIDGLKQFAQMTHNINEYKYGDLFTDYRNLDLLQSFLSQSLPLEGPDGLLAKASEYAKDHGIKSLGKLIDTTEQQKEHLIKYVQNANPALTKLNTKYYLENLSQPANFQRFARRYGVVFNTDPTDVITNINTHVSLPPIQNGVLEPTRELSQQYHPIKDIDHIYDDNKQGLRIGWNSANYDSTFVAHIVTAFDSRRYSDNNMVSFYNLSNILKIQNSQLDQIDPYYQHSYRFIHYILMLKYFYQNLYKIQPDHLVRFNDQMFKHQNWMAGALKDERNHSTAANQTKTAYDLTNRFQDTMDLFPHRVSLKLVAAMLGLQIKESSTNTDPHIELQTLDDISDLTAYNISDVNATKIISEHPKLVETLETREKILKDYPILNFQQNDESDNLMEANQNKVRFDRLNRNSTSAQLVEHVISPYPNTKIVDLPAVDYMYPDQQVLDQLIKDGKAPKGTRQFDALEDTMRWAIKNIPDGEAKFKPIYELYSQYRGKNFNFENNPAINAGLQITKWKKKFPRNENDRLNISDYAETEKLKTYTYVDYHGNKQTRKITNAKDPRDNSFAIKNVVGDYVDNNGEPTGSTYNASGGGIHGMETKHKLYLENEKIQHRRLQSQLSTALNNQIDTDITPDNLIHLVDGKTSDAQMAHYLTPMKIENRTFYTFVTASKKNKQKYIENIIDGTKEHFTFNDLLKRNKVTKDLSFKIKSLINKFTATSIAQKYRYISVGLALHQDFSSYYPTLIVMLAVFRNVQGQDIYANIYHQRLHLKKLSKTAPTEAERKKAKAEQKPLKLFLNSATGVAYAPRSCNITARNAILKMRIIGQLFAWRIGEALSLKGARIPSTNTDGLYAMGISVEENKKIVAQETAPLFLNVDPEIITKFVSKDANNRLESIDGKIREAKGGTLSAWQGPDIEKTLSHPAIVDHVLAYYLNEKDDPSDTDFDRDLAKKILDRFIDKTINQEHDIPKFLQFMQWIMRSSNGSHSYLFLNNTDENGDPIVNSMSPQANVSLLEPTNRVFLVTEEGQKLLAPDMYKRHQRIFMAAPQTVSKLSGVLKNLKNLYEHHDEWFISQYNPLPFDQFSSSDELIHAIKNHEGIFADDTYNRQEYFQYNDPLAQYIICHYNTDKQLRDPIHGLIGRPIQNLEPSKNTKRDKIKNYALKKISDLEDNQPIVINNRGLADYPEDYAQTLIKHLNYDEYLNIIERKFNNTWAN